MGSTPGDRHRLLVVDDAMDIHLLVGHMLRTMASVTFARNGEEALHLLEDGGFTVALVDIQMPEMNGFDLTRAIRQFERERDRTPLVVIGLSSRNLAIDEAMAKEAGMDDYLTKPLRLDALNRALVRVGQQPISEESDLEDSIST